SVLGFCVLGGIFGEGIDLKEDRLIGAIVVGTGIPLVCFERELLKDYFNENGGSGFDYAYRFPGMNKVLQAAGRVIRTERDLGVVALLDGRFLQSAYRKLYPVGWENYRVIRAENAGSSVQNFWEKWN
ncbi:MAG: ATP-dependent DNA helicase, partial [Lachnospiraceae bacterium]|nr:ATP-dependent DNA helicase [Lachnospiraceae bacterium]